MELFSKFNALINEPTHERMPSLLLIGDSGNGKTTMVKQFYNDNIIVEEHPEPDSCRYENPVLYVESPPKADLHDLYNRILMAFWIPVRRNDTYSEKESKIKYYVEINKIKLLIIDEIHNALIGSITKQKEFIVGLKTLTNLLQISMVMVGIDTALNLTNTDQQISSRFRPVFIDYIIPKT